MDKAVTLTVPPHQERFYEIATKLLQTRLMEETYKVICDEAIALVDAKYASIFIMKDDSIIRAYASSPELYEVIPRIRGLTQKTFLTNKAYLRQSSQIQQYHPAFHKIKIGSDITAPLSYQGSTTAVLSVLSRPKKIFTNQDLDAIRYLSPLASLAIQSAEGFERLEKAIDDRNLFISVAAHEIRSPLTAALGFSQYMELRLKKGKGVSITDFYKLIKALEQLKHLVNEFLEIDRIKKGLLSYTMKRWSLTRIVQMAIDNFQKRQPKRKIVLENLSKGNSWVFADRSKLIEVFTNLLSNAHRYSPISEPITMSITQHPLGMRVNIIDKGIGIPEEQIPRIFDKFYTTSASHKGMGLGLFLTKSIVDKHNGNIIVTSVVNKGTTFTIELPHHHA